MKPLFIIYLLAYCFVPCITRAQVDSGFSLLKTYKGDITDAVMDNLDNLYIISSSGQVRKFNEKGDSVAIYNQVRNAGKLFSIDVSNPLRPLLFYKDFSTIVLLDRFLANRTLIDLKRYNILQPGAAGVSYDNNIWVFDEYDNKLKKVDEQGKLLVETPDLRTLFPVSVHPQKILSDNGLVYLADTANGVFVFDNYGSYKKKIAVTKWQSIAVKENYIIQTLPNEIIVYNSSNFMDVKKAIPASFQPYIHSFSTTAKLVTFTNDTLRIYQYRF
ncbi:MAG TPA: hypothetical protein VJ499_05440 [Flavisolibacter sp.]|nr:hypothetical protein [Flavisolibacter sp.]